jgi:hypothetical protein
MQEMPLQCSSCCSATGISFVVTILYTRLWPDDELGILDEPTHGPYASCASHSMTHHAIHVSSRRSPSAVIAHCR